MISLKDTPAVNPLTFDTSKEPSAPLAEYERQAMLTRLAQIAVAVGHPTWTAKQLQALLRERAELQRKLATDDSR
jgi:hypothetical protein